MEHLTNKQIDTITRTVADRIDLFNLGRLSGIKTIGFEHRTTVFKNYRMLRVHCNGIVEDLGRLC